MKNRIIVIAVAIIGAFIAYAIFSTRAIAINELFFVTSAFIATFVTSAMLISDGMHQQASCHYCNNGNFVVIGGAGAVIISLAAYAIEIYGFLWAISYLLALLFFFLALMFGGIWAYLNARNHCGCNQDCDW